MCVSRILSFNFFSNLKNVALTLSIIAAAGYVLSLLSLWFTFRHRQTQMTLQKSKETLQMKLKEFNFDVRSSLRMPSPSYRNKSNAYPGRIWRLQWGEMQELPSLDQNAPTSPGTKPLMIPRSPVAHAKTYI